MARLRSRYDTSIEIQLPKLHARQIEAANWPQRFRVLNAGRRFGKNVLMHDQSVNALLDGQPVGWGSPTYKSLTEDWRTLTNILKPITTRSLEQERRIECITGGVLEMWTLDNPDPIRGRSYKFFVVNEAAQVRYLLPTWNEIIHPTLIDLSGGALFGSTPKGLNDFHTLYSWGQTLPDWKSATYTSYENPYIDNAELDALKQTLTDRQFRQEIMAEFLLGEAAVFRNLDAALTAPYEEPADHQGHVIVGGCDWGRDNDYTALSLGCVDCAREIAVDRFNQIDYFFQRQRLEAMSHKWSVKRWEVELNSIGAPNFESLQRAGLPVVGFTTTHMSKQPLIEAFSLALERGDLRLLPDDAGRAELQAYEVKRTETGASKYSAPDGMHDDTVIARALMWRAMQTVPRPRRTRTSHEQAALERWLNK